MRNLFKFFLAAFVFLQIGQPIYASPNWERLLGYTLIQCGDITGYKDRRGKYVAGEFVGCEPGRKLYLDNSYYVICNCIDIGLDIIPRYALFSNGTERGKLYVVGGSTLYDVLLKK